VISRLMEVAARRGLALRISQMPAAGIRNAIREPSHHSIARGARPRPGLCDGRDVDAADRQPGEKLVRQGYRHALLLLATASIGSPLVVTACATHRMYDPYYRDYHVWDGREGAYYERWETETRRDHVDFSKRSAGEQKEYWMWRHNHPDTDHNTS